MAAAAFSAKRGTKEAAKGAADLTLSKAKLPLCHFSRKSTLAIVSCIVRALVQ